MAMSVENSLWDMVWCSLIDNY